VRENPPAFRSPIGGHEAQPKKEILTMTIKTNVKAGGAQLQHNETLTIRSGVKAGGNSLNHNESFRR
jgi:hypothetical protein